MKSANPPGIAYHDPLCNVIHQFLLRSSSGRFLWTVFRNAASLQIQQLLTPRWFALAAAILDGDEFPPIIRFGYRYGINVSASLDCQRSTSGLRLLHAAS